MFILALGGKIHQYSAGRQTSENGTLGISVHMPNRIKTLFNNL
jgi:hypothetical protein